MQFSTKSESRTSKIESRIDINAKTPSTLNVSTGSLPSIEDILEKKPVHYVTTTEPSTKPLNIVTDVEILTLNDETTGIEPIKIEVEVPF